jgi:hypothetical protein
VCVHAQLRLPVWASLAAPLNTLNVFSMLLPPSYWQARQVISSPQLTLMAASALQLAAVRGLVGCGATDRGDFWLGGCANVCADGPNSRYDPCVSAVEQPRASLAPPLPHRQVSATSHNRLTRKA